MNAKITITVPLEEIPNEVSKILENISERLKTIVEKTNNCTYNQNYTDVIEEIDHIRKQLNLIDLNFEDSYNVLLGYIKYQTDLKMKDFKKSEEKNDG